MFRHFIKTACFLLISSIALAQTKDEKKYSERASEVQQEVMDNLNKAFDVTIVPEKYKDESAVVIARSFEMTNSIKSKFKMFYMGVKTYRYYNTVHERVLIQDKSALDEYSTLNYKKIINNSADGFRNIANTYIGAKVYKRDGKIISINPKEEEVMIKDEKKEKEGRIAIPDLQVGDILDYYIRTEEIIETGSAAREPDIYILGSGHPILYLNAKYVLDKKGGADVLNANGARPLNTSTDEEGNMVIEFTETDLPKLKAVIWSSLPRSVPYYMIRYGFPGAGIFAKAGEIKTGPFKQDTNKDIEKYLSQIKMLSMPPFFKNTFFSTKDYFGGMKNIQKMPADTVIQYLWNLYQYERSGLPKKSPEMDSYFIAQRLSTSLTYYGIDNDLLITGSGRFSTKMEDGISLGDYNLLIRINTPSSFKWLSLTNIFETPGSVSAKYQGEKGLIIRNRKKDFEVTEEAVDFPVSKSDENILSEDLQVFFYKENLQLTGITRTVSETGNMKLGDQEDLLLDTISSVFYFKLIEPGDIKPKKNKQKDEEAMLKQRLKHQEAFKKEIKEEYDQEPKEFFYDSIINTGLLWYDPQFIFKSKFSIENFVKKAGNNLIFDAGKLMGIYKKTEDDDRTRTTDIYMPVARQLHYKFNITIPEGYSAKGMENILKNIENETGSFSSSAELKENIITITVKRVYNHNFEPAANWPKLLAIMDAAAEFTNSKLLFEKKK